MLNSYNIPVKQVAEYFLSKNDEMAGDCISNLKMQKLVYYAQGFVIAITGKKLFNDGIIAWQHGPVVPELYEEYKEFRSSCIPIPEKFDLCKINSNSGLVEILDDVYDIYGQFSAWKLRNMTHEEKPWLEVPINQEIKISTMKEYFKTLLV